jgi:hypothetical protein
MEKKIKKYYNKQYRYINKILNIEDNYQLKFNKSNYINIYINNNLLISGEYYFFGIYQLEKQLWMWASSIPGVSIEHINNIRKIRNCDYLFENSNNEKDLFYHQLLTQDILYIKNKEILKWINNLLLYLSNSIFYFNPINSDNNIQFILLKNIKEKYL